MPIGTSKVGALGGLVPGGTETFNASGTFCVPPGVKKVSVTGAGGTGNPGNPGNAGNPGVFGTGAGAGSGGSGRVCPCATLPTARGFYASPGGFAMSRINGPQLPATNCSINGGPFGIPGGTVPAAANQPVPAGVTVNGNAGTGGQAGSGGSAGSAGNPGNSGCPSSAFCITFPAGAGGNAGSAGAAGTAGAAGAAGNGGNGATSKNTAGTGGSGGTGGGSGGSGSTQPSYGAPIGPLPVFCIIGGSGGGGAGTTNPGQNGPPSAPPLPGGPSTNNPFAAPQFVAFGGNYCGFSQNRNPSPGDAYPIGPPNRYGGLGLKKSVPCGTQKSVFRGAFPFTSPYQPTVLTTNEMWRSGAGGGGGGTAWKNLPIPIQAASGGGGGGGGRGGAGNAGGAGGSGGSGVAGTPSTSNCVPVTPGGSVPIVVGTGGSVVISWNPQ